MHFLRFLMLGLTCVLGSLAVAWATGALYFDLPAPPPLRTVAAIVWALAATVLGLLAVYRGRLALLVGVLLVAGWWSTLRPRLDRDWQPQVALLAYATRDRDRLTVHNVRNFEYWTATQFTPRYETRNYDLANLHALDLFVNYWGSPLMAHPILSFDFGPQGHLCFSIETRPERGKAYSTIGGLYRQFELIYIAADERHSLAGDLPFAELKSRARINERARAADDAADFSDRIRTGLPGFDALQRM